SERGRDVRARARLHDGRDRAGDRSVRLDEHAVLAVDPKRALRRLDDGAIPDDGRDLRILTAVPFRARVDRARRSHADARDDVPGACGDRLVALLQRDRDAHVMASPAPPCVFVTLPPWVGANT